MNLHPAWMDWPETKALIKAFADKKVELRFVGGCVRDALLGRPVKDVDAATPLLPADVMKVLQSADIKAIPTGIDHGTVTAVIDERSFEITTLRRDVSTDGRHAKVEYTDDWKQDASRRDFTMNAMYLSPSGELFDYFGGEADAKAGKVRFIGDATQRIAEDYLRILRFFRFHAWYGKGEVDEKALAACAAAAAHIETLSGERLQQEMFKLLAAPAVSSTLKLMKKDILRHVFGFPVHNVEVIASLEKIEKESSLAPDPLVRLALLLPSLPSLDHLSGKWKLSNDINRKLAVWLGHVTQMKAAMNLQAQKKLLRKIGSPAFKMIVLMHWAEEPQRAETWRLMCTLANEWLPPEFPISGDDLKELGIAEGKQMGEILRELEEAWEASDYQMTREELLDQMR